MRAVDVLEVDDPATWEELAAMADIEPHLGERLGPTRRVALPSFQKQLLPLLAAAGRPVLLRWARRSRAAEATAIAARQHEVEDLDPELRRVLWSALRHAEEGVVLGRHAWDPLSDAPSVRALHGLGLLQLLPDSVPFEGRYRLDPDLPSAPAPAIDVADARMEETEDLPAALPGPLSLLHDLASVAAAIEQLEPRRTHAGAVARVDARRLLQRLGGGEGDLEAHPRWGRALRGLEALRGVSMDPVERVLHLDLGLERLLSGEAAEAVDHLVHRLVEPDLHAVVRVLREALRQAGREALDEVVLLDLLREQARDLAFCPWRRDGALWYPTVEGELPRGFDDAGWERVEANLIRALFGKLVRLGILRRAPGVIAATADGRVWAGVERPHTPPIWVSSDLEIVVPPEAITPGERFQLERLGRCLSRDVVDRYKMERKGLETWLSTHELEEAMELLRRRAPGLPAGAEATLRSWGAAALKVRLVRGVILPG